MAEPTLDALDAAIPQAIADLYEASGEDVVVTRVDDDDAATRSWVAVPAHLAEQAIAWGVAVGGSS